MAPSTYRTPSEDTRERAKEAEVPDLIRPSEANRQIFIDRNGLRQPEDLLKTLEYTPNFTPFSLTEELAFAEAFKHSPKNFGAIAALLPGRSAKECKDHYYASKFDGRFKTESKRERDAEKGVEMMQLDGADDDIPLSQLRRRSSEQREVEADLDVIPIDREIERLRTLTGEKGKMFRKGYPKNSMQVVVLPRPELSTLHRGFIAPFEKTDDSLLVWLRSASVLPLLKLWYKECIEVRETFWEIQRLLPPEARPWDARVEQVVDFAQKYGVDDFNPSFKKNAKAFVLCVNFATKIARANPNLFEGEKPYGFPKNELLRASVLVLFTTFHDLMYGGPKSFFTVLLKSELAGPISPTVRQSWEKKYVFEGEGQANAGAQEALANPSVIRVSDFRLRDAGRSSVDQSPKFSAAATTGEGQDRGVRRSRVRKPQREVTTDDELATTDEELNDASHGEGNGGADDDDEDEDEDDGYSSDGIPEYGEAAVRGLRAKACGLEDANRKILNLYKETRIDLESTRERLEVVERVNEHLLEQIAAVKARLGGQMQGSESPATGESLGKQQVEDPETSQALLRIVKEKSDK